MAKERTTVIVPNFNGAHRLRTLLESLATQTRRPAAVLLVDNGSSDESCTAFASDASRLQLEAHSIRLERNFGFAHAVNRGILAADTGLVALVNNDVLLDTRWLESLEDALLLNETAHFACPLLCSWQNPALIDGTFDLLTRSGCAARALHGETDDHSTALQPRPIQFPPMTAALFRRSLFQSIGLLDESYESYLEDVDFGLRAAAADVKGIYVPEARALHAGSGTLGQWSRRATRLISCNQLRLIGNHYPSALLRSWCWPIICGNVLFLLMAMKRGQAIAAIRGKLDGLAAFREGRHRVSHNRWAQARLTEAICTAERELHTLVTGQTTSAQRFWRTYFRFCPPPPATLMRAEPHQERRS